MLGDSFLTTTVADTSWPRASKKSTCDTDPRTVPQNILESIASTGLNSGNIWFSVLYCLFIRFRPATVWVNSLGSSAPAHLHVGLKMWIIHLVLIP